MARVLLVCPLFGGLSSLGVSFIGGFTVILMNMTTSTLLDTLGLYLVLRVKLASAATSAALKQWSSLLATQKATS